MSLTAPLHLLTLLFQQEIAMASGLLDALQQEQTALIGNSPSAIEATLTNKQQLMADLEKTSQLREAYLRKNNYPAHHEGMLACIHDHDPQEQHQLAALWRQLNTLATQCLQQNQLNGSIISTRRLSVQAALSILRGSEPTYLACYTPTGQGQTKADSHSLGQA